MSELALVLTKDESNALAVAETVIARGLRTFNEVGQALLAVRDGQLYRADFPTFEAYCSQRWQISRPRAYELMAAATVVSAIADKGLPLPSNEGQARELARVPEAQRAEVWRETIERTEGKPTAAAIRETHAPALIPGTGNQTSAGQNPTELPGQQDLADVFLSVVDDLASGADPHEINPGPPIDFGDITAGTIQKFRSNFATARLRARELTTFSPDRINEVHAANWDREVGDILNALDAWITQVREIHRDQQRSKLRLVNGGRS